MRVVDELNGYDEEDSFDLAVEFEEESSEDSVEINDMNVWDIEFSRWEHRAFKNW